jgi:hypothetical protein
MISPLSTDEKQYIAQNLGQKIENLLLNKKATAMPRYHFLVEQIAGRQKIKDKIPSWFANDNLLLPAKLSVEQCSSELTAMFKTQLLRGHSLLDMTGGYGVDFLHLAANFPEAQYLEQNPELCQLAQHNANILGLKHCQITEADSQSFLQDTQQAYSCIYIDPARRNHNGQKVYSFEQCNPNVVELYPLLRSKAQHILIKAAPLLDISLALKQLPHCSQVYVVQVNNEVKELLFYINTAHSHTTVTITAVELLPSKAFSYTSQPTTEKTLAINPSPVQQYLYEPAAAVLKAGAFKSVAQHFGLNKLHEHTHLYSSQFLADFFPGKVFEVLAQIKPDTNELRKLLPNLKANLTLRNYPGTAIALKNKLGLADGGEHHIFAITNNLNQKVLLITKKNI